MISPRDEILCTLRLEQDARCAFSGESPGTKTTCRLWYADSRRYTQRSANSCLAVPLAKLAARCGYSGLTGRLCRRHRRLERPCSAALLSWGRDEVVLVGAGNADAGHRDASVVLSVRNVAGLENGLYEVRQPKSWDTAPHRQGDDGIGEVVLDTPLSLASARNSRQWGWWDIKVSQVAPSRARDRVSSFFTRTTGDGSEPGEFRRIGVSIVRDSNRAYRLILWGEDPDTDRWLRIGVRAGRSGHSVVIPYDRERLSPPSSPRCRHRRHTPCVRCGLGKPTSCVT